LVQNQAVIVNSVAVFFCLNI